MMAQRGRERRRENSLSRGEEVEEADGDSGRTSGVLIRVRTATMTSADSAKTLTDLDSAAAAAANSKEQRFSPNPAGAASAPTGSHIRHTTNSSVESEGFHSVTSEDISFEETDWTQWSKQVSFIHLQALETVETGQPLYRILQNREKQLTYGISILLFFYYKLLGVISAP